MDLLRILDAKPEPRIVDTDYFQIDPGYQNSDVYKIATPMSDFQKELIDQIVSLHYSDILRFFEKLDDESWDNMSNNRKEIIASSLETLLENTKLVCLHPYLLINHFFPKSLTTRDLPNRLAETSGKFQILNDLLIQLDAIYNPASKSNKLKKGPEINVAVLVRAGKAMDLVDALCIGHRCNLKRYTGIKLRDSSANQKKNMNLNLNIHLLPCNFEDINEKEIELNIKNKMNFIFLFELETDLTHPFMNKLVDQSFTKFFKLIPINSVEHIQSYYEQQISSKGIGELLKPITAAIVCLRDRVGQLPSNLKPAYTNNLLYLRDYLANPLYVKWPLPDLPHIGNFTSRDVERSLLTEVKFNFDNEEILREEEENRPSVHESLNTNFGGKTQMIGHIIQPRFSKKNPTVKNYYDNKRLEKNYLMNPLNKEYKYLSGISSELNQHDVLTHTLVHHFSNSIKKTTRLNEEVNSFNKVSNVRIKDFEVVIVAYEKLSRDLSETQQSHFNVNKKIEERNQQIEKIKHENTEYQDFIDKLSVSSTIDNEIKDYIVKDMEKYDILEEINRLEQKLEGVNNENKYMTEEIDRAEKAIVESHTQIDKHKINNQSLQKLVQKIKDDNSSIEAEEAELRTLNEKLKDLEEKHYELDAKIKETLINLSEIGHRSRHTNYHSRNKS